MKINTLVLVSGILLLAGEAQAAVMQRTQSAKSKTLTCRNDRNCTKFPNYFCENGRCTVCPTLPQEPQDQSVKSKEYKEYLNALTAYHQCRQGMEAVLKEYNCNTGRTLSERLTHCYRTTKDNPQSLQNWVQLTARRSRNTVQQFAKQKTNRNNNYKAVTQR